MLPEAVAVPHNSAVLVMGMSFTGVDRDEHFQRKGGKTSRPYSLQKSSLFEKQLRSELPILFFWDCIFSFFHLSCS